MIKQEHDNDFYLHKRIEWLETQALTAKGEHITLRQEIEKNTKITEEGLASLNKKIGDLGSLGQFYQSTKTGSKFVIWIGSVIISIGTTWILIREVFHSWLH